MHKIKEARISALQGPRAASFIVNIIITPVLRLISITAARCVALRGVRYRDADSVFLFLSPRNVTRSRSRNKSLLLLIVHHSGLSYKRMIRILCVGGS